MTIASSYQCFYIAPPVPRDSELGQLVQEKGSEIAKLAFEDLPKYIKTPLPHNSLAFTQFAVCCYNPEARLLCSPSLIFEGNTHLMQKLEDLFVRVTTKLSRAPAAPLLKPIPANCQVHDVIHLPQQATSHVLIVVPKRSVQRTDTSLTAPKPKSKQIP